MIKQIKNEGERDREDAKKKRRGEKERERRRGEAKKRQRGE